MGWWWNQSTARGPDVDVVPPSTIEQLTTPSEQTRAEPPPFEKVKKQMTREEQSNQELIAFLKEIQAESEDSTRKKANQPKITSASSTTPEDISPDSLYPTEISCRSAFDYAFFCQSFGGQFVNVYRFGGFRSCSNHWQDFWLCMRTRNWNETDRAKAVQEHYRKKAIKYKTGPSSEDVWEVRTEPLKDAFQGDLEKLEQQMMDWQKANYVAEVPWAKAARDD